MKSIEELNETVREHKLRNQLSVTERAVLDILSQYSCKTIGESFLAKSTIADLVGKSRRTIIRVCNRLELLGIIQQHKRMRQTGDHRQTSNLIVILPVKSCVTPECHSEEAPSINSKTKNITKERTAAKPAWIPAAFFGLLESHIDSVKEIEDYWRSVHATTYRMDLPQHDKEQLAIHAFMAMKAKRRQLRKPIAFFTGVVKRMAQQRYVTGLFDAVWTV